MQGWTSHFVLYYTISVYIFYTKKKKEVKLSYAQLRACGRMEICIVPVILYLNTRWNDWSGFHHCSFIPGGKSSVIYWAFLGILGKWEISCPHQELKSDSSYVHLVAFSLFWLCYLGPVFYKRDILSWHLLHFIPDISSSCMVICSSNTFQFTYLKEDRSRVRFPMVSLEFFSDITLPVALWPWGRLSL